MMSATPPGRLLSLFFCGFVAGAALQLQQRALLDTWLYAALVALVLALAAGVARWWMGGKAVFPLVGAATLLLALVFGFGLTGLRAAIFQAGALDPALEGKDITVTGRVLAMPQRSEDGLRFRFAVASARLDGQPVVLPAQIYLGWYAGFGGREATPSTTAPDNPEAEATPAATLALQRQPQTLRAGETWRMTVRLKAPHGNSNPHGFDYELWLWEQGLQATGYVRVGSHDVPPIKLADGWRHPVERARQSVRDAVFARVADRQLAGVVAALLVGDQNAIERADWDVFRATGVAHLMSISGLHITMFAWLAARGIAWLWRRSVRWTPRLCLAWPASTAGAWGGLLLAAAYALFSGWGVPAQRTVWMLAVVVLLRQSGKRWPWPQVCLLAMAAVVALDPWALMQAGFWLSFVAVSVLFAAGPPQGKEAPSGGREPHAVGERGGEFATDSGAGSGHGERTGGQFDAESKSFSDWRMPWLARAAGALGRAAREQWVVTLALTPLSLLLFNQGSLVGLLANALAIPWVTLLVTPLTMLGVVWAPAWDGAAAAVAGLMVFLQWLAAWPLASISVAAAPLWCALAGVAGGVLLAMRLPWHWRVLGVPLLLPVLLWQALRPVDGQFELLAADVGQGNALLVRTAGHTLVYDTGPRFSRESDAGHRVLVPLLRAFGERVDTVMLSHRDSDHIGGAPAVLAMQPQAALLSSIEATHPLQALRPSTPCVAGQRWWWDGVQFDVLHPAVEDYALPAKSNAMSCVLRISNGQNSVLLAGDIELAQEQRLVAAGATIQADVLLVPHHGSKTSSSAVFLDAVQPRLALAQAGYRNRFGHPAAPVLARYHERGIAVFVSPVCGAATWSSQQPELIRCQRQVGLRYWHHQLSPQTPETRK
ncbi:DNA internalization-related competence protein ComEC/Rec2 [Polaromonas sp. SM01]|uniref:DNA internalization-related competence protein ComEC/Rec2 n=1 Tax=Polaromonas sp. SM01 TaxID=3085630 RepID=UPI0029814D7C|nr:DNA internalization-related competence protein ComEC/Rec2 [Polaromonas sp. SM01]MDW5444457.1 DNA internalization-related competence protein ComEC/Rec2 [Polaromonas sp. SM01]